MDLGSPAVEIESQHSLPAKQWSSSMLVKDHIMTGGRTACDAPAYMPDAPSDTRILLGVSPCSRSGCGPVVYAHVMMEVPSSIYIYSAIVPVDALRKDPASHKTHETLPARSMMDHQPIVRLARAIFHKTIGRRELRARIGQRSSTASVWCGSAHVARAVHG
jgi:hypothetical protein